MNSKGKGPLTFLDAWSGRRRFFTLCAFLSLLSLVSLAAYKTTTSSRFVVSDIERTLGPPAPTGVEHSPVDLSNTPSIPTVHEDEIPEPLPEIALPHSPWLNGPPTQSFRDNLRNDTKYVTSFISAGWNNDVMTYMNLLYMGKITDRVPIVATFTPSHILQDGVAPPIAFGEVFDVPRFIQDSGIPMVEWDDVKDPDSPVVDDLGCWNIWQAVQYNEPSPRPGALPDWIGLDISWTKAPDWVKLIPNYEHDKCSTFYTMARLAYADDRDNSLGTPTESPIHHATLDPDEQLLCYDFLFYACTLAGTNEWEMDYAPQWRFVGRHLHWTSRIESIAASYVKRVFGLPADEGAVPPYITIHVRHGDFGNWCWEAEDPRDCFAPLSVIARRVQEVQDEIRRKKGIVIPMNRVIVTSDEKDENWWNAVSLLGWARMDHSALQTVENYGLWYVFPVVLDAAIQSNGLGFVGTDRSTFSVLSKRRVQDWHNGATRMVKWGKKGADDH
ncbi:hypothetical protein C8Q75DRAFT_723287 [Abortiporus biennis]|nr:hypothetical protein C8Q75DRAFT_723287 [Abortiporus biennis]